MAPYDPGDHDHRSNFLASPGATNSRPEVARSATATGSGLEGRSPPPVAYLGQLGGDVAALTALLGGPRPDGLTLNYLLSKSRRRSGLPWSATDPAHGGAPALGRIESGGRPPWGSCSSPQAGPTL